MISIIVPVYNVAPYLRQCLRSCLEQTYSEIEVVAVNDGSTDKSGEILNEYAQCDSRLRVFHQENEGVTSARNKGLEHAKGEWVMFVDSDDTIAADAIEVLLSQITSRDIDIVVGHYQEYFPAINYNRIHPFEHPSFLRSADFRDLIFLKKIQWGLCAKLYKKTLFSGVIPPKFRLGEDACVLIQVIEKANKIALTPRVIYTYLQRSDSAVHNPQRNVSDLYNFRRWIVDFVESKGYDYPKNLNFFIIDGYTEYLFFSKKQTISNSSVCAEIAFREKNVARKLHLWQRLLLWADRHRIGIPTAMVLRPLQKVKFWMRCLKWKCQDLLK